MEPTVRFSGWAIAAFVLGLTSTFVALVSTLAFLPELLAIYPTLGAAALVCASVGIFRNRCCTPLAVTGVLLPCLAFVFGMALMPAT